MSDNKAREEMRKISRRSFLWAGAALIGTYGGFKWLASRHNDGLIPWPMRRVLALNEDVWTDAFSEAAMAPTFDRSLMREPKVNGTYGLRDPSPWSLRLEGAYGEAEAITFTLEDIKKLPRHEFTAQFCCIEGWSVVVNWAGARLSDFIAQNLPPNHFNEGKPSLAAPHELVRYIYMATPDEGYYVGLDMQSALHPQTLLCYEMNGAPLTEPHGAPLRLVIPTKYGVKNIKRLALIRYTDEKPRDYWAEQGYDWYAGL